ncbi:unnamed protein product [Vitrella brassicaformis CCMP3155]|uniref:Uncharacterized protein n=2 Tax=Vitrella brassicaformis TaxID=1169539 RepID=A0A0G4EYB0_VITBC|nr:unnamed protein product [Vitrella brassicaformis CCMP3155]|mmetsp:Transcript_18820/g.53951  ORF Transcript_18820/g.53951 Transcript_18820/m.53951 type:complete len:345 (-) Transcript_18820:897-1931(-)|eukprot:CEM04125.1 unnamed protein product [Vitrella brassicaformis CCMP3155]
MAVIVCRRPLLSARLAAVVLLSAVPTLVDAEGRRLGFRIRVPDFSPPRGGGYTDSPGIPRGGTLIGGSGGSDGSTDVDGVIIAMVAGIIGLSVFLMLFVLAILIIPHYVPLSWRVWCCTPSSWCMSRRLPPGGDNATDNEADRSASTIPSMPSASTAATTPIFASQSPATRRERRVNPIPASTPPPSGKWIGTFQGTGTGCAYLLTFEYDGTVTGHSFPGAVEVNGFSNANSDQVSWGLRDVDFTGRFLNRQQSVISGTYTATTGESSTMTIRFLEARASLAPKTNAPGAAPTAATVVQVQPMTTDQEAATDGGSETTASSSSGGHPEPPVLDTQRAGLPGGTA